MTTKAIKQNHGPKTVGTKVTPPMKPEINGLIEAGVYLSVSDFLRDAVRDKLKEIKVINIRGDVDYDTAIGEVLGYYKKYKRTGEDEVAENLELDYELVFKIVDELEEEGRLKVVK